jgi:predicted murein hydrolase (TIGR00659 family)
MSVAAELVHLSFSLPLAGLFLTVAAYEASLAVGRMLGSPSWANPVLGSIVIVGSVLSFAGESYADYFETAKFIHQLLAPAVVALAIPLHNNLALIRRSALAIASAIGVGSLAAALSTVIIARSLGADHGVILSLAPKSVTTPVAIGVSYEIGGIPELTTVAVIISGIFGAIVTVPLLRLFGITCPRAIGLAGGVAGHGITTARLLQIDETAGAFSGLAMGLSAIAVGTLMPLAFELLSSL